MTASAQPAPATSVADRPLAVEVLRTLREDASFGIFSLWVNVIAGSPLVPRLFRAVMLRLAGIDIARAQVRSRVFFVHRNVSIGSKSMVNIGTVFEGEGGIRLGSSVHVAPEVLFCTSTHDIGRHDRRCGTDRVQPITVGDGCWIGARATIMPGVDIAPGCVIAAGSLVTKSTEPDGLYAGSPAKLIRKLD